MGRGFSRCSQSIRPEERIGCEIRPSTRCVSRHMRSTAARLVGALLVLAAGAIHLHLYFLYFHSVHVVGVLFLLNFAAGLVIGLTLLAVPHPLAVAAAVGFSAATLAAFFLSVYVGLFGYVERLRGPWQEAAGGIELAALVVLTPLLLSSLAALKPRRVRKPRAA